ncbi:MAG: hypothetical protein P8127_03525, partial [Acidobacteriota bacterium]
MMIRKYTTRSTVLATLTVTLVCLSLGPVSAMAAGPKDEFEAGKAPQIDDRPDPLTTEQRAMRKET